MNITKKAILWANTLNAYGFLSTDSQVTAASEIIERARKSHKDDEILKVLARLKNDKVQNPLAYLRTELKLSPIKQEPITDEKLQAEIAEDDATMDWLIDHSKWCAKEDGKEWHELDLLYPDDPRMNNLHVAVYKNHTWKSLYDEAKANGTSIKRLCDKYGLNPMGLIYGQGGMYK